MMKKGRTVQAMPDLKDANGNSKCWKDCAKIKPILERYGLDDNGGTENLYIINENGTQISITKAISHIKRRLLNEPQKNFLIVYIIAGQGMHSGGSQVAVLNEFDKQTGFYKLWGVEADIRGIADTYRNSYSVAFFSCCREVMTSEHRGGFSTE